MDEPDEIGSSGGVRQSRASETTSPFLTTFAALSHERLSEPVSDELEGGGAAIAASLLSVTYHSRSNVQRCPLTAALASLHALSTAAISSAVNVVPKQTRASDVWNMLGTPPVPRGKACSLTASNSRRVVSTSQALSGTGTHRSSTVPEVITTIECASRTNGSHASANCLSAPSSAPSTSGDGSSPAGKSGAVAKRVTCITDSGVTNVSR
mmetsp:Transcript_69048/g.136875  ORF Transcript_69048/g.136875 Transcript_69048/m.136875 type:complete len:210 (+) Transcript_69048:317-946(+)